MFVGPNSDRRKLFAGSMVYGAGKAVLRRSVTLFARAVTTRVNLLRFQRLPHRYLEIGAGKNRIPGFESLDIVWQPGTHYIADASRRLPFADNTFDVVHASHVLEHIPWYDTSKVLLEWVRILRRGGQLEIWVPDALKICRTIMEAEGGCLSKAPDGWSVQNPCDSPYVWAAGRLFWGANQGYPSWHRSFFTPRYLKWLFENVGLKDIRGLNREEVRGYDHGWINLGMTGVKP